MADVVSKGNILSSCHHHWVPRRDDGHGSGPVSCRIQGNPPVRMRCLTCSRSDFLGRGADLVSVQKKGNPQGWTFSVNAQGSLMIGKAQRWWGKELQPYMKEVKSAQDLVNSLQTAGDKLVVVAFFSPGCGACKALHPKICQLAEGNPDVLFLQVNYEAHKSMCYSLGVHVLPFFRFYRGAQGRLCSFSCTNATIKKFKDALAKHAPDRCSLRPVKGLEEKELLALAANKDLSFTYTPEPVHAQPNPAEVEVLHESKPSRSNSDVVPLPLLLPSGAVESSKNSELTDLVTPGR